MTVAEAATNVDIDRRAALHYGQPDPRRQCRCLKARQGRTCYDPRCSLQGRDSWARRESCIDSASWRYHIDVEGLDHTYTGNLKARVDLTPEQHRDVRRRFLAGLRKLARDRDLRYHFRATSEVSQDGRPHDHYIFAADGPVPKSRIRAAFILAAAEYTMDVAVQHELIRSLEASICYAYKATAAARGGDRPIRLHKPRLGLPIVWGTRYFTPGGRPTRNAIWAKQVAEWKGNPARDGGEDILVAACPNSWI